MNTTWLTTRLSFAELDGEWGLLQAEWNDLKTQIQPADELWEFQSPQEYCDRLAGSMGVALVRGGQIVCHIVTIES